MPTDEERELQLIKGEYMELWKIIRIIEKRRQSNISTMVDAFWRFRVSHPNAKSWLADK